MMNLVPYPSGDVELRSGDYLLPKQFSVALDGFAHWSVEAFLTRCGCIEGRDTGLSLKKNEGLPREGYSLEITGSGIYIEASTETGVIWALTTAANLLKDGKLPCCHIEDAPQYPHRGISLDCARHFFSAEEVKRIINTMSLAKLNVLHWHLADDQGWRIESKRFPKLQEVSKDYFTQDEIREVVQYAALRGVEVIPEIDLPGHTSSILAAYPEYSCSGKEVNLATCGGIYPVILCAGQDKTFAFLEELLTEIAGLFPAKRFHIGGDEAPKSEWKKCPHCQARMQELGITSYEDLQADFSRRVCQILKKLGKDAICWNETLRANTPPEDVQIQYWTLQYRDSMEKFADNGGKWIYSDMFELYLDYPHSMTSLKKLYHTKPHLGKRPVTAQDGLIGLEGCLWAEHITERVRLENLLFPRAFALGEICWCGAQNYDEFLIRLDAQLGSALYQDVHITDKNWWDPKGSARRKEAIGFFTAINSGMSDDVREQTVESAAPNQEFAQSFMNKFFEPLDIPFLLASMFKNEKKKQFEDQFTIKELAPNTYRITESALSSVNMYLLVGSEKALLIDSGYGNPKLKEIVEGLTDKPVVCACTHGHIDHAMGAYLFDEVYLHSADFEVFNRHSQPDFIQYSGIEGIGQPPKKMLKQAGYLKYVDELASHPHPQPLALENVESFDLGGRVITWFPIPGHTPGCVAFLEKAARTVYDGDGGGNGAWLFLPESLSIAEFKTALKQYDAFLQENEVTHRYGGHMPMAASPKEVPQMIDMCQYVMKKQASGKSIGIPYHFSLGDCRIVLRKNKMLFIRT